jgi:site-specific DNA-cytosine methylase
MSNGSVTLVGKLKKDGVCNHEGFGGMSFAVSRCAHDIEEWYDIKVSMNQWTHVISKSDSFIAIHASIHDGVVDTTKGSSGVICAPSQRVENPNQSVYTTCELFAGGFSGWSHVLRMLTDMGYNFSHKIAVDFDPVCAEAYCRSHGFQDTVGPEVMKWEADELPERLFVEGDVLDPRWYHLLSDDRFDIAVLSPPCPPWSKATSCPGLMKHEGRLTVFAWALLQLIRPKTVCMEMVGNMRRHEHWSIIKMMILWAGYSIRFAPILNLAEFTPQHRERLIIVATLDTEDLQPHICQAWPATQRQTLETFLNVMRLDEPWKTQSSIEPHVLQMYLDPALLPKSGNEGPRAPKKTKLDVESYRIRHVQGVFGCIMASYGSGHELPDPNLRRFGLYGTLLAQASGLRFLSVPEIAIAHSALMPFWLPHDCKSAVRILGNAISIPHAMVGILNAVAFLSGLTGVEVQEIMLEVMTKRFTSQNLRWEMRWGGFSFTKDENHCQPTQMMHSYQKVTVFCPTAIHFSC